MPYRSVREGNFDNLLLPRRHDFGDCADDFSAVAIQGDYLIADGKLTNGSFSLRRRHRRAGGEATAGSRLCLRFIVRRQVSAGSDSLEPRLRNGVKLRIQLCFLRLGGLGVYLGNNVVFISIRVLPIPLLH